MPISFSTKKMPKKQVKIAETTIALDKQFVYNSYKKISHGTKWKRRNIQSGSMYSSSPITLMLWRCSECDGK